MYEFNNEGILTKTQNDIEHIYDAVLQRLEDLLRLISDDAELEVDYNAADDTWITMEYYPEKEMAVQLSDANGNPVVAFKGVPHDIMEEILNKTDVWFVG